MPRDDMKEKLLAKAAHVEELMGALRSVVDRAMGDAAGNVATRVRQSVDGLEMWWDREHDTAAVIRCVATATARAAPVPQCPTTRDPALSPLGSSPARDGVADYCGAGGSRPHPPPPPLSVSSLIKHPSPPTLTELWTPPFV